MSRPAQAARLQAPGVPGHQDHPGQRQGGHQEFRGVVQVREYRDHNFVRFYKYYTLPRLSRPYCVLEGVTPHSPAPHNNHEENERHNFIFNVFNVDV